MRALSPHRAAILAGLLILASDAANAQSMTPMRGKVVSFTDRFAIRVWPGNPYSHNLDMQIAVYDDDFGPIRAQAVPAAFNVGPGDRRSVLVIVPFAEKSERTVRVCTRARPERRRGTTIATEICGRFQGIRRSVQ